MKAITIILFSIFSILFDKKFDVKSNIFQANLILKLDYGFSIKFSDVDDYKTFKVYKQVELFNNGAKVFSDNKLEYEVNGKPTIIAIDATTFEILLEVNDRPNKNYIKLLRITNNKIISENKLPTFITKASNLDNDKLLEYAGFWDYGEVWGDNNELTAYNPILYYEITKDGIKLDSTLTIKKNTEIYKKFGGFEYNEKNPVSIKLSEKFNNEVERIEKIGKK